MLPDDPAHDPDSGQARDPLNMGGTMPDLQALLHQASAMQERLIAAQQELDDARFEGTAGGGLAIATVSGTGELVGLTIDPSACDPDDTGTLADLVLAAVKNAVETAHRHAAATMGDLSGGFGGALGGDLGAALGGDLGAALGAGSEPESGYGSSAGRSAGFVMPLDDAPGDERT